MALTGNTVQSTYLDLVQLEKSGAGLPAHAGKEAALYDGSGAQILGRSAVRHWLDPHPDAAAFTETWEFSTKGMMNQAALEAAGWTFVNCTGSVANGMLTLVSGANFAVAYAYLTVSFAGDFDITASVVAPLGYGTTPTNTLYAGGVGVGDTADDVAHHILQGCAPTIACTAYTGGTMASFSGTATTFNWYGAKSHQLRINRASGTVACRSGTHDISYLIDDHTANTYGWSGRTADSATTFTRLFFHLGQGSSTAGATGSFRYLRRFQ